MVVHRLGVAVFLLGFASGTAFAGETQSQGGVTSYVLSSEDRVGSIDFDRAKPLSLPMSDRKPVFSEEYARPAGVPGFVPGSRGTGWTGSQVGTVDEDAAATSREDSGGSGVAPDGVVVPEEFGTSSHPFTTSRVDLTNQGTVSKLYPYSAAGKLYFNIGSDTYVCSASLIKPGIILTAAHCVIDFGGGSTGWYSNWKFVPAQFGKKKPFGTVDVVAAWVMTSYYNGTDTCAVSGVVCANDVALLIAKAKGKKYPGKKTGWLGYGWDGYGYTAGNVTLINQLGYPVSHDEGLKMQRSDSQGFMDASLTNNTVWGSRQTGGSSGGPEVINLGAAATLLGTGFGTGSAYNIVVGVTSWGYVDSTVKQQGASRFTASNVPVLVDAACTSVPAACAP